jgi:hypothetical protein
MNTHIKEDSDAPCAAFISSFELNTASRFCSAPAHGVFFNAASSAIFKRGFISGFE